MGDANGNQIIGLMRFSYISKGGFAHSHDPQAAQEAMIYNEARMERRFELFENFALRSLKQQTDQDFKCIFLITKTMPKPMKDRLHDLVAGWAPAVVVEKPFMPQFRAIRACYEEHQDNSLPWVTTFRLDDDDMLDRYFVNRIRDLSVPLAEVKGGGQPVVMAFNKGIYLEIGANGNRIFDACERTPLSVGTAMITPAMGGKNIYSRNHRKLPAFFTTYQDVDAPSWLRTIHRDNDSVPEFTALTDQENEATVDKWLTRAFRLERDWLMSFGR